MIIGIIIIATAIIIYFFFFSKKKEKAIYPNSQLKQTISPSNSNHVFKAEIFTDANGKYRLVNKTKEIPRKTYLQGTLNGKYWGEIDVDKEEKYKYSQFYDFHIYEVVVNVKPSVNCPCLNALKQECSGLHEENEGGFTFIPDANFPRERLPQLLPVVLSKDGKEYEVNIYEPQLANVYFISELHQTEGKEVFGTIQATITGYLLDFITEYYTEPEYLPDLRPSVNQPIATVSRLLKTSIPSGNTEFKSGYQRTEYYYSDYKTKYWGDWKYKRPATTPATEGCLSSSFGILGGIIGVIFLLALLPKIAILIPFILIPAIFRLFPETIWTWILRFIGMLLLFGFIISIINTITHSSRSYLPKTIVEDKPQESKPQYNPITDTVNQTSVKDTLISHYRSWKDYDGNKYEGKFWLRKSALNSAASFKNNLNISDNTQDSYNQIVFRLKENDKNNLEGVYQMFDSIKSTKNFSAAEFAELIVSFIQDIPYSVVLPDVCDGALYPDSFIKSYLASGDARCDGNERFGINTPVEFLATLNGDCDTRTLTIYTILTHYGYDVAMLSSEYYNHSLIGVNLPYNGITYNYNTQQYTLWETTAPNVKPGILPTQLSNLKYWRISLKSK